jgi:hypothetical protein
MNSRIGTEPNNQDKERIYPNGVYSRLPLRDLYRLCQLLNRALNLSKLKVDTAVIETGLFCLSSAVPVCWRHDRRSP